MSDKSPFLISFNELAARLGEPGLKVVDGSWYLPAMGRNQHVEFEAGHIPGAVFFDQDAIVAPGSDLPHTLPSADLFAQNAGALGISERDTIVVYDGPGFFSAPRVWWMFRLYGAKNVLLLDGGFDAWKTEGHPTETGTPSPAPTNFTAEADMAQVVPFAEMLSIVQARSSQIADARPAGRFTGEVAEPRPGMRGGHMPGARSVPITELAKDGKLKSLSDLSTVFESAGIDISSPVITSCGSGVTAAAVAFALMSLGHEEVRLYDGSWSEWGGRADTPIATGEA